ncbi:hypothetical protein [Streptomyces prasinus]
MSRSTGPTGVDDLAGGRFQRGEQGGGALQDIEPELTGYLLVDPV